MQTLLLTHIFIGLCGIVASYIVLMGLLKKEVFLRRVKTAAFFAFLAYLITWITGGGYYLNIYGPIIKPLINKGEYPWAHSFFMETKEHIFLFLPIISFVIWLALISSNEHIIKNDSLRRSIMLLAALSFAISVAVALFGVVVSGAK